MPRLLSPTRPRAALAAAFALACLARPAAGQGPGGPDIQLKSPVAHQVIQRDARGLGEIPIVLPDDSKDVQIVGAWVSLFGGNPIPDTRYRDGKLERVPAGGPYIVAVFYKRRGDSQKGRSRSNRSSSATSGSSPASRTWRAWASSSTSPRPVTG